MQDLSLIRLHQQMRGDQMKDFWIYDENVAEWLDYVFHCADCRNDVQSSHD